MRERPRRLLNNAGASRDRDQEMTQVETKGPRRQASEGRSLSLTSCCAPVLSTVRRLRLEEQEFEASLGHKNSHKRQNKSVSHMGDALLSTEG